MNAQIMVNVLMVSAFAKKASVETIVLNRVVLIIVPTTALVIKQSTNANVNRD